LLNILLLIKFLISYSGITENQSEKLSLTKKYFPDAELVWNKSFEGKMIDFEIAKDSRHVVIGTLKNRNGYVYLFSPEGELLWTKENDKHSKIEKCISLKVSISNSAETISILWYGDYEDTETQVYNINGELISSHDFGISIEVSPEGHYIKLPYLYSKTGEEIVLRDILRGIPIEKLNHPHITKARRPDGTIRVDTLYVKRDIEIFTFISEGELAVILDKVLYFFSFPDGKLRWKSKELELGIGRKITPLEKYILISGRRKLYLFDKDGKLKWEKDLDENLYSHTVSFSSGEEYLAIYDGKKIFILDSKTAETELSTGILDSQIGVESFLFLNNHIFLSGYTGSFVKDIHKGYWTYILQFDDNLNIVDESWEKGLVLGTYSSPLIAVYESDADGKIETGYQESILGYENATFFNIAILKNTK
jgi:hypothetical protein